MSEEMRNLYLASKELNQQKWWEVRNLIEPVVFKNPYNDELAYCVFIGYGVNIYLGERGISSYFDLIEVIEDEGDEYEGFRAFSRQDMMGVSFENRQDISDEDYEKIKSLGLNFRGKKQWPEFRRYRPGIIVGELENIEEIKFFTAILQQLKLLLLGIKSGKNPFVDKKILKMTFENGNWQSSFIDPGEIFGEDSQPYVYNYKNDLKVHRLKKLPKVELVLEGIQFFLPEPFLDEETNQGMFPFITAFVEQESGQVYFHEISSHKEKDLKQLSDKLADFMLKDIKCRPSDIVVEDLHLLDMIEGFCEQIDVECYTDYTPVATEFVESILSRKKSEILFTNNDLEDEEIPDSVMELVLEVVHQVYDEIKANPSIKCLSKFDQAAVEEISVIVLVDMILDYQQMPPNWNSDKFTNYLKSNELEESVESKFVEHIYPSLIKFLECASQLGFLVDTDDLIEVVHKHYQVL